MESLRVIHLAKGPHADLGVGARLREALPESFYLDSCQRLLWVCWDHELDLIELPPVQGIEVFEAQDAYRFLLRVSTGLESQIVGETDIFGQLKEAWRKTSGNFELDALMQRLFEDTKEIRSRYLQNLGGSSYGSLVRMMLKQSPGPTLVLGAGQLAQSVAPYLLDQEIWISNRSLENLGALYEALKTRAAGPGPATASGSAAASGRPATSERAALKIRLISKEEEAMAWQQAAGVVICIPFDAAQDVQRVAWRGERKGPVIHLGGPRELAGAWNQLPEFEALDDLFALQKSQGEVRTTLVLQAARACDEKAKLRGLGNSVTLPHGWEDLAVFA